MENKPEGQKIEPMLVQFSKSQLTVVVATATILFALVNFTINYVEKRTDNQNNDGNVTQILNNQTAILARLETVVNANNRMLLDRTSMISDTQSKTNANNMALANIGTLLTQQAAVLSEQTKVLQKLSVWLDMQIKKGN